MNAIETKNLVLAYTKDLKIIKDISLEIPSGTSVALLGHNGSGKSTLLKGMIGLLPAESGEILINQKQVTTNKKALKEIRSECGFVFQNHNLVGRLGVLTNVIHGLLGKSTAAKYWLQAFAPSKDRELALKTLESVGLAEFAARKAAALSGGQAQRVAIARSLINKPSILFADEPTASLDPVAGTEVMTLLHNLCKENGITLVFTTHDLEHAKLYSDRTIALKHGKIEIDSLSSEIDFSELGGLYA